MSLVIPDDVVFATRMTKEELLREIAVMLFQKEKLTLAQAAELASMPRLNFQHLLASRNIPVHYDVEDLHQDMETLHKLGLIDDRSQR